MRQLAVAVALLLPALLRAQSVERVVLDGRDVAIYNLAGRLDVQGGTGDKVIVEVARGGADGRSLTLEQGMARGRRTFRVRYPSDRIVYSAAGWHGRTTQTINDDGSFGDGDGSRRRIEVMSDGDALDAHADLKVFIPRGATVALHLVVGLTTVDNVDGNVHVEVGALHTSVSRVRGSVSVETGSGGVEISDITGDLNVESGSGGMTVNGVRGGSLHLDVGSGGVRGGALDVKELIADIGSGGVRLSNVRTDELRLDAGSGTSDFQLLSTPKTIAIESGSGGVTLRLPSATSADLDIDTGSGGIDSDFEVKLRGKVERHALRGTIGSGASRVRIEAGSGSVRLIRN